MYIEINGVWLYYETAGHGQALLLLHGNGEDCGIFDQVIPFLSQRYQVFALDFRDHGRSQKTAHISYQEMTEDVIGFCNALRLHRPVLYGFSDGGIVGLMAAYQRPELLSRLVVSGANTTPTGLKHWFRVVCRVGWFFNPKPRVKMMLTQPQITPEELGRITVPTLVLAGQHDLIKRSHTQTMAAAIPNAKLKIIKGENHASYVLHSRKLLEYL